LAIGLAPRRVGSGLRLVEKLSQTWLVPVNLKEARHKLCRVSQDRQRVILAVRQLRSYMHSLAS
jgi:hypothetical protein